MSLAKGASGHPPAAISIAASAQERQPAANRRAVERMAFSDAEIIDGFFKIAFGAELDLAGSGKRIRKFEGPVSLESRATPTGGRRSPMWSPT